MTRGLVVGAAALACWMALNGTAALAQTSLDSFQVYTAHPRLFLRPQRLRLLRRERERNSMRWEQFHLLISGGAPMPEPGFANALYYQIAGDKAGRATGDCMGGGSGA